MEAMLGGFGAALILFGFILAILWICMPFAVFGTKDVLRELIAEQKRTNELLQKVAGVPRKPPPPSEY